jgi:hypothetical protein
MRTAPAVQVVVARQGAWLWAQAGLFALSSMLLAVWLLRLSGRSGLVVAGVVAIVGLLAGTLALQRLSGPPQGLRWDGTEWQLGIAPGTGLAGQTAVMIDLGGWMLLRFQAAAGRPVFWLPVSRRCSPHEWHGLRAALFAARSAAPLTR